MACKGRRKSLLSFLSSTDTSISKRWEPNHTIHGAHLLVKGWTSYPYPLPPKKERGHNQLNGLKAYTPKHIELNKLTIKTTPMAYLITLVPDYHKTKLWRRLDSINLPPSQIWEKEVSPPFPFIHQQISAWFLDKQVLVCIWKFCPKPKYWNKRGKKD